MPLTIMKPGVEASVKKVGGKEETRQFLAKLGFVLGSRVTIITEINENVIVSINLLG